jgi:TonB family protein
MIAAWMLYCVGIGLAFVVAGRAIEWTLHLAGRQTRWAWCIALAGTLLLPAAAWLAPQAFSTLPIPFPEAVGAVPMSVPSPTASARIPLVQPARAFSLRDLDGMLQWGWGLSSAAMLLLFAAAAVRLSVLRRRWRTSLLDGRTVLVSENMGPAVAGLWRPRIVVPDWALQLTDRQRELMLAHEEEHLRAGDPRLLAWTALAVAAAPWNPALWWQLRRLRLAVEMDCDTRVLARVGAAEYGELLLHVGRHRSAVALGAPALGDQISFLEHRIRRMATSAPRWRWFGAALGLAIAAGAVVGACEAPRPTAEASGTPESSVSLVVQMPSTSDAVSPPAHGQAPDHEQPEMVSGSILRYPDLLRHAGIQGQVIVQAVIDTTGRAEPQSVRVVRSPHPGFNQAAQDYVLQALFRPARAQGHAVRALMNVPLEFRMKE